MDYESTPAHGRLRRKLDADGDEVGDVCITGPGASCNPCELGQFNCIAFALGFHAMPRYHRMVEASGQVPLPVFADALELASTGEDTCVPDRLLLYRMSGRVQHAAVSCRDGTVLSKWGRGRIHRHLLWDVPASYGDQVTFHARPDSEGTLETWKRWLLDASRKMRPEWFRLLGC